MRHTAHKLSTISPQMEKETALTLIASASNQELWDVILALQTDLYFEWEKSYFQNYLPCWSDAKHILFVGCGNGAHMIKFAEAFPEKKFHGIDNNRDHLKVATQGNQLNNASFSEENVYVLNKERLNCYDIVVMRFVIQHLDNLKGALINVHQYLKQSGMVVIVDANDSARRSSMKSEYIDGLFREINNTPKVNRKAAWDLMNLIDSKEGILGELFFVDTSNIDKNGQAIANKQLDLLLDNTKKTPLFAQKMIFFGLWKKQYKLDINLGTVYDEYKKFIADPNARLAEGFQVLTLKKL